MSDREAFEAAWGAKYVSQSPEEDEAWYWWQAALAHARQSDAEAQMEIERLRTALENMRRELNRAWREVDFIAKERTEHLEWRTKLANDLDECERMRDTLARALNKRENDMMLLLNAVDAMMAYLGYHGEISTRDDRVQAVMDALAKIDAKEGT